MIYRLASNYYGCTCGGTFAVDLKKPSYGAFPCTYAFLCGGCGKTKYAPCQEELKMCAEVERGIYARKQNA